MNNPQLNDIIKSSKNILIISHINPDGDTLGSMTGLYSAIKDNFKKECDMLCVSKIPHVYQFLPYVNKVKTMIDIDKSREYDLTINVDIAAEDRSGDAKILFDKGKLKINFDHHKTNTKYGDLNFVDSEASSCGELLYHIFKDLDWEINKETATCLYTAILTDTGSFRFDNASPSAFKTVSELTAKGVHPADIYKKVYESDTKGHVLFQAYCVSKTVFLEDDKIAYTTVYKKDMEKFSAGEDCTEGLTEKLRAIVTTKVAFVVKQMNSASSKVSMRSKGVDVAEICSVFGGGGHTFAAGCIVKTNVEEAVKRILEEIRKRKI